MVTARHNWAYPQCGRGENCVITLLKDRRQKNPQKITPMSGIGLTVTPPLYSTSPSETTGAAEPQKLPNCKSTEKIHSSNPRTQLGKEILQEIPLQNTLGLQRFHWYPWKGSYTWDPTGWTKWYIVSMSAINKPSHLCKHLPSRGRAYFQESSPIYKKHFPLHCPKSYNSAITQVLYCIGITSSLRTLISTGLHMSSRTL